MEIVLKLSTIRRFLTWAVVLLAIAGLACEIADDVFEMEDTYGLIDLFHPSHEQNIPTWFSTLVLFACSTCLALISLAKQQIRAPYLAHWWTLAVIFAYISLDEFVSIHEDMSKWFDFGGVLYFGWVIPAGIFVAIFGLSYLRFLAHLDHDVRNRFVLAGVIYVGGALVVELPLGYWKEQAGQDNLVYGLIDMVEETMEMTGASLFLYTLVAYLSEPLGRFRISTLDVPEAP